MAKHVPVLVAAAVLAALLVVAGPAAASRHCELGVKVASDHARLGLNLTAPNSGFGFGYTDDFQGSGIHPGDVVYLDVDVRTRVSDRDVRFMAREEAPPGSRPVQGDVDLGGTITELGSGLVAFLNVDGDNAFDQGEPAFVDADGDEEIDDGDVYIHPPDRAGQQVSPGAPETGQQLIRFAGLILFHDTDEDGIFDAEEHAYIDVDESETITAGDVCLTRESAPTEPTPSPSPSPSPTTEPTPPPTETTDPTEGPGDPTVERRLPGFGVSALFGALGAAMLGLRRRD